MKLTLTEGSVFERLRREPSISFDEHVAHAGLIYDDKTRAKLELVHRGYASIAREMGRPMILQTDTWRASRDRVFASGLPASVNEDNVAFLRGISEGVQVLGLLGPSGDAYNPREALSEEDAVEYHSWQAERLKDADILMAATLHALTEAKGLARAMGAAGKPYILSFVVRPTGQLLDETSLALAIKSIDDLHPAPWMYAINCAHPDTAYEALENTEEAVCSRIQWLQANASRLSPEELDNSAELRTSDPVEWAGAMMRVALKFNLKILGGCCGTDSTHIRALAKLMAGE